MKYVFILFLFSIQISARVLTLSQEKFASYFSGEMSSSLLKTAPFDDIVTATDSFSDEYKLGMGGEFGFVYSTPYVGWRFAFEILKPGKLSDVTASQSGTVNYLVSSDVTVVSPKLGIEIHLNRLPSSRIYLFACYGSSNLTMTNTFTGVVVSPNSDHEVQLKSTAPLMVGGFGMEWSFVDTTTFGIELGYRSLVFSEIKYAKDVTSFSGSKVAGDLYQNTLGENKTLNFSSYFGAVTFRFWL
jgi:hypothetical protein